jgi:ribonuclease HII
MAIKQAEKTEKTSLDYLLAFDKRTLARAKKDNPLLLGKSGKVAGKGASARLKAMQEYQLQLFKSSSCGLIGVDEVGRGCLSGPVVACAVLLPQIEKSSALYEQIFDLDDSKLLNVAQRERIATALKSACYFSLGEASPAEIDEINILQASLLAMKRALDSLMEQVREQLPLSDEQLLLLVDGNQKVKNITMQQLTVIQGDSHSASIAAASVIAKVHRDALMADLSLSFPHYGWHTNKGYGSKVHRTAIVEHGVTEWHRKSFRLFRADLDLENENESEVEREEPAEGELSLELQFEEALG